MVTGRLRNPPLAARREAVVQEHIEAAADQVLLAAATNDASRVKSTLAYWFALIFDEALRTSAATEPESSSPDGQPTERLKRITAELKRMSDKIEDKLDRER